MIELVANEDGKIHYRYKGNATGKNLRVQVYGDSTAALHNSAMTETTNTGVYVSDIINIDTEGTYYVKIVEDGSIERHTTFLKVKTNLSNVIKTKVEDEELDLLKKLEEFIEKNANINIYERPPSEVNP